MDPESQNFGAAVLVADFLASEIMVTLRKLRLND
jgi:hypothetical protein